LAVRQDNLLVGAAYKYRTGVVTSNEFTVVSGFADADEGSEAFKEMQDDAERSDDGDEDSLSCDSELFAPKAVRRGERRAVEEDEEDVGDADAMSSAQELPPMKKQACGRRAALDRPSRV
jgi:hypothetical protein